MTNGRKDLLAVMVIFGKTLVIALVIPVVPHCAIPFLLTVLTGKQHRRRKFKSTQNV